VIETTTDDLALTVGQTTPRTLAGVRRLPVALWLGAIVAASAGVRFMLASKVPGPGIFPDELIYADLARSFGSSGHFLVRGEPFGAWTYGPLYPVLISPAFALPPVAAFTLVKAINCAAVSLAAIPVYLLARRMVKREPALLAASLALLLPSLAYSSRVMTESVAYPLFVTAVLALVRCLELPTLRRQLVFLLAISLAVLARAEAIVLVPGFVTAVALLAVFEEPRSRIRSLKKRLRAFSGVWFALAILGLIGLVGASARDGGPAALLGPHKALVGKLDVVEAPKWIVLHLAELDLAVGVIPFAALILMTSAAFRRSTSAATRTFLAATLGVGCWLVVLAGVYATQGDVHRIQERYLFYVEPLVLIAFLSWVASEGPRPGRRAMVTAATASVLPLLLPYSSLLNYHVLASSPGLVAWLYVRAIGGSLTVLWIVLALSFAGGILLLRARDPLSLVRPVVVYLVVCALIVSAGFVSVSERSFAAGGGGGTPNWIDRSVGSHGRVVAIWSARGVHWARFRRIWESEFFNRSVGSVYYLRSPLAYSLPQTRIQLRGETFMLPNGKPLRAEYVLSDGPVIQGVPMSGQGHAGLTLYRVGGVVRVGPALS
jgi:4-amino-4-deoxy-L-arabinose transferase-like glycosyltransferase